MGQDGRKKHHKDTKSKVTKLNLLACSFLATISTIYFLKLSFYFAVHSWSVELMSAHPAKQNELLIRSERELL